MDGCRHHALFLKPGSDWGHHLFSSGFPHREQTTESAPPSGEERMLSAEVGRHLLCESHWADRTWGRGGAEPVFSTLP